VQLDPQQENRRLRASAEKMRSKQRFAVGGITAGGFVIAAKFQFAEWLSPSVGIALRQRCKSPSSPDFYGKLDA
jgi:hypothetical protein